MNNTTGIDPGSAASLSENARSPLDFLIGLAIVLGASLLNAFGLNITKLDHARNTALPKSSRKPDYLRPLWILGLFAYIVSQLVGSTLALAYLSAQFVAPLGSTSLIFNFVFAYLLVKTQITKLDIIGTVIIICGVVGVIVFGNHRSAESADIEAGLSLPVLKELWSKGPWIAYFIVMQIVTSLLYWIASIAQDVWDDREALEDFTEADDTNPEARYGLRSVRNDKPEGNWAIVKARAKDATQFLKKRMAKYAESKPDVSIKRILGFLWSLEAGILSGQTLIFGKSIVKIISSHTAAFDILFIVLILLVCVTAVAQIVCLNRGLRVADSTLVVPVLFACYSGFSFIDSLIYLDQLHAYTRTVTAFIVISLLVLLSGVVVLSSKKVAAPPKPAEDYEQEGSPSIAVEQNGDAFAMSTLQKAKNKLTALTSPNTHSSGAQLLERSRDGPPEKDGQDEANDHTSPFEDAYAVGDDSKSEEDFDSFVEAPSRTSPLHSPRTA